MPVTADCLFHFTTSLKNLESILTKKFRLSYCKEEFILMGRHPTFYFPMITFCDIPLSQAKEHILKYGEYAIGLSKEWGEKHKLNPVIYLKENSALAAALDKTVAQLEVLPIDSESDDKISDLFLDLTSNIYSFTRYIKNYEENLPRGKTTIKNYRFYDEREWRFIPDWDDDRVRPVLTAEEFESYRGAKNSPKPLIDSIELKFNANDIKYLIVKSNADIPKLIHLIKSTNELTSNPNEADILTTKIITVDQLNKDF